MRISYSEENAKDIELPIFNIRRAYIKEMESKNSSNTQQSNIIPMPPPPPPPPNIPTVYTFLKTYYSKDGLEIPFEQGVNLISIKEGKVFLNDELINSDIEQIEKITERINFGGEGIFVIILDENTTYGQYMSLLESYYTSVYKLRDQLSLKLYNSTYSDADELEKRELQKKIPMRLIDFSYSEWDHLVGSN